MKHLLEARNAMITDKKSPEDVPVVSFIETGAIDHSVKFTIQDGPIKEVGINGCQAVDMLEFVKELFNSLNRDFPCRENSLTITKLEEAIHWQDARTKDRENRNVEGRSEK